MIEICIQICLPHSALSWNLSLAEDRKSFSLQDGATEWQDNLKILKVEYLSNHLLNHSQIFNLSLDDQAIFYKSLKWRQPLMEDDLKY